MNTRTTILLAAGVLATAACNRDRKSEQSERNAPTTTAPKPTEPTSPSNQPAQPGQPTPQGQQPQAGSGQRLERDQLAAKYQNCVTLINTAQLEAYQRDCIAQGFVGHEANGPEFRIDSMIGMMRAMHGAFSDHKLAPQLIAISGRNILAVDLMTGTNQNDLQMPNGRTMPKTGKKIGVMVYHRLAIDDENKVREEWVYSDPLTILGQLGKLPQKQPQPTRPASTQSWTNAPIVVVAADNEIERANLEVATKLMQAVNAHDANAIRAFYADDAIGSDQTAPADLKGRAAIERGTSDMLRAFPDLEITIANQYAAGDYVIVEGRITGTHKGPTGNIPPTNKQVDLQFAGVMKIENGKVTEEHRFWNRLAMLNQLGVIQEGQRRPDVQPQPGTQPRPGGMQPQPQQQQPPQSQQPRPSASTGSTQETQPGPANAPDVGSPNSPR